MTFFRIKRRRGRAYAYLVENRWDSARGQPRQRTVRYLGRVDTLRAADLPPEHRTPRVLAGLARASTADSERRSDALAGILPGFLDRVLAGDYAAARRDARLAVRSAGLDKVYDEMIPAALHEIGDRWAAGRLGVSQEHLASGIVARLLQELNASPRFLRVRGPLVVLAVPEGETHTIGLSLAEGLLLRRGYRPLNLGGAAPTAEVSEFVVSRAPFAVLLSVTMRANLGRARTLAAAIVRGRPGTKVAIGGQALGDRPIRADHPSIEFVRETLGEFLGRWPPLSEPPRPEGRSAPRSAERRADARRGG